MNIFELNDDTPEELIKFVLNTSTVDDVVRFFKEVDGYDFAGRVYSLLSNPLLVDSKEIHLAYEEVVLKEVRHDGCAIYNFANPSEIVQLTAVRENGYAIKYIDDPSEAVQLEAVKQNYDAIDYIYDPTEAVKRAAAATVM
nr:hypothetical protein [Brevundimonas naejangsanensis]